MIRIRLALASLLSVLAACAGAPPTTDVDRAAALDRAYERYRLGFPGVQEITVDELKLALASDQPPLLVDVRPEEERAVSILPGALPLEELRSNLAAHEGRVVVTYCTAGVRSGFVADSLRRQGVEVRNLRGSILAWTHGGGPLVTPAGEPTRRVHTWRAQWNYAASDYQAVF